jgi:hypothetical protein
MGGPTPLLQDTFPSNKFTLGPMAFATCHDGLGPDFMAALFQRWLAQSKPEAIRNKLLQSTRLVLLSHSR